MLRSTIPWFVVVAACGASSGSSSTSPATDDHDVSHTRDAGRTLAEPDAANHDGGNPEAGSVASAGDAAAIPGDAGVNHDGMDAGSDGTDGGSVVCSEEVIMTGTTVPDVMIVLDASTSMIHDDDGAKVDTWSKTVTAIKAAAAALEQRVNFGLFSFPGYTGVCDMGAVAVPFAIRKADAIASSLDNREAGGGSPIGPSLGEAGFYLTSSAHLAPTQAVMLVTNGEPNCTDPQPIPGCPPGLFCPIDPGKTTPQAVAAAVSAVTDLATAGIRTYVLGVDTHLKPAAAGPLDDMAAAGATGDTHHHAVQTADALTSLLTTLTKDVIGCEVTLKHASRAGLTKASLDGMPLKADPLDGFTISEDGRALRLRGKACDKVLDGTGHSLRVSVSCS